MKQVSGPTPWRKVAVVAAVAAAVVTLILLAFSWPTKSAEIRNTPLSVSGSAAEIQEFKLALDTSSPGAFEVVPARDRDTAIDQIHERTSLGAVVINSGSGIEVLSAPAASPAATQVIVSMAEKMSAVGADVNVAVVVPLRAEDPNGSGLAAMLFPLSLGGVVGGLVTVFGIAGASRQAGVIGIFGLAGGLLMTVVTHTWFGFVGGNFFATWAVVGVTIAATAALMAGLAAVIGRPGVGMGAVLTMFVANPLAGVGQPWQWIVEPFGWVGQHMAPGAAMNLLRSISYFPDAATTSTWLTVLGWLLVGGALLGLGTLRQRRAAVITG